MKRDGDGCANCGASGTRRVDAGYGRIEERSILELDHRLPIVDAPHLAKDLSNLQLLCFDCHKAKTMAERSARASSGRGLL